nr:hypothetical protein [Guadeloupe mosquito virus]
METVNVIYTTVSDAVGYISIPLQVVALMMSAIMMSFVVNPLNKAMLAVSFYVQTGFLLKYIWSLAPSIEGIIHERLSETYSKVHMETLETFLLDYKVYLMAIACGFVILLSSYIYVEVRNWWGKDHRVFVVPNGQAGAGTYVSEKAMPGSSFEVAKVLPTFQAMVMASLDGITYHVMGQCFWVDEGLVTAAHVIEGFEYLCIYKDEEKRIEVGPKTFEIGNGDYAVCRNPTLITQKLGLSKAKFARLAVEKDAGLSVNITAMGKRTIGFLDRHPQFGYVRYSGSTIKGFSGAPYYFGRTIFGMHLGSDSKNLGYDGAFLKTELKPSRVIRNQLNLRTEDSASFLEQQLERYEEVEYSRSPYNPDEYKVRIGGMYHIVDEEVLSTVLKRRSAKRAQGDLQYLAEQAEVGPLIDLEAVTTKGDLTRSQQSGQKQHQELSTETDPIIAMTKGLLSEFGKTSVYVPPEPKSKDQGTCTSCESCGAYIYWGESRDIPETPTADAKKAEDLPLAPRNAMTFNDSENLIRAPAVVVGARGMEYQRESVQSHDLPRCKKMDCMCQKPLETCLMESRTLTRAPPKEASARTVRNKNRRMRRQQQKKELEQFKQLYGPIPHGGVTSHPQLIPTNGLIGNSIKH